MSLISLFIVWTLYESSDQLNFATHSYVNVKSGKKTVLSQKSVVKDQLISLAKKQQSLIVKRIVEPTKEGHEFVYECFGEESLPKGYIEATEEATTRSTVQAQYMIVRGDLTEEMLSSKFSELGYEADVFSNRSPMNLVISFLASFSVLLAVGVLLLSFIAITLMSRIKNLRSAGIRFISGESLPRIIFNSIRSDCKIISISFFVSCIIGTICLKSLNLLRLSSFLVLISGPYLYSLVLVFISIILSLIYLLGLKRNNLVGIVKGKLPIHRLLIIIMIGQLIAVIVIGWSIAKIPLFYNAVKQQEQATKNWNNQKNRVNIQFNINMFNIDYNDKSIREEINNKWFLFAKKMVTEQEALLVYRDYLFNDSLGDDSQSIMEYSPTKNTLYVTPNYFTNQSIHLDNVFIHKLNNLKAGEFGLVLPEKLKNKEEQFQTLFENYMINYSLDDSGERSLDALDYSAIVGYVPNNQSRFTFNNTAISSDQFMEDPILVVVTPQSMEQALSAQIFWTDSISGMQLFFSDYETTLKQLENDQLYKYVSYISNSRDLYYEQLTRLNNELIYLIGGTILGIITSVLLFSSMNLFYFEEFRREIFIKRISGMNFIEVHQLYILIQLIILLIGFCITIFITGNFLTSLFTLIIFVINALLILYRQMKKENKLATIILKGK